MNRKQRAPLVVISIIVVAVAVLSVPVRVALVESEGIRAARADFEELAISLGSVSRGSDLADPALRASLARHYAASPGLLLALVAERGKGLKWRIPDRSPYLPASENSLATPRVNHPDRSSILLEAPLRGDSSGSLILGALYVAIPQSAVYLAFRDAALGLGLWLIIVLALLVALGRQPEVDATWRVGGPAVPEDLERRQEEAREAVAPVEDDLPAFAPEAAMELDEAVPGIDDFETVSPDVPAQAGARARSVPHDEEDEALSTPAPRGAGPQGLFSPLSGLGWESYLTDRLDAELSRSASFEQDLSLLLVTFDGLAPGDPIYALLSKSIADFFSFRDLAFERGPDGFAVILPNLDADHGLRMAEEFHKKLTFLIREEGYSAPLDSLPLCIGMSSRAGRLVEASRLLGEAEIAIERARSEGDTKILAFKPDPDKYRLYLAAKGI